MLSWVALRLACMCGKATLAMVVSSTWSSTAIITPMVTMIRSPVGSGWEATSGAEATGLLLRRRVEIHCGGRRQAGDHRLVRLAVEYDRHRHALGPLDPIAVGILGRQQRELAARSGADALHVGGEFPPGISVD